MAKTIKTVFLDVDGVLVSFRKGIYDAFNKPYEYSKMSDKWVFWDDWPEVTFEMVNAACTIEFWRNLEWMFDGHDILRSLFPKFELEQIYLLTTPMPNPESATGRWMWILEYLPAYYERTIISPAPKFLLARPDRLLIDDKDENVDEFIAAGGQGLLVPRSYNRDKIWANEAIKIVRRKLEKLI